MKPFVPDKLPLKTIDWGRFVRLVGRANAALARFDGVLLNMANPHILLSPLTTQEAVLSSKIEGTQTTLEEVLRYEAGASHEPAREEDIREVLNYRQALRDSVEYLKKRPFCLDLLKKAHHRLMSDVRGQERDRGQFRKVQNWIGRPGSTLDTAKFVPPDPVTMNEALSNWEQYIHFDEQDRLVQLALIHGQFEIIHPFADGNGRLGRMIIPLVLFGHEMLSSPVFYLSEYLERHRAAYYDGLHRITETGEWNEWIEFFLTAIAEQAQENTTKGRAILDLHERMKRKLPEIVTTQYSVQVLDALFDHPVFSTTEFSKRATLAGRTTRRILSALVEAGILRVIREQSGRVPAVLVFGDLMTITEGHARFGSNGDLKVVGHA
jgi:Fic family protein